MGCAWLVVPVEKGDDNAATEAVRERKDAATEARCRLSFVLGSNCGH